MTQKRGPYESNPDCEFLHSWANLTILATGSPNILSSMIFMQINNRTTACQASRLPKHGGIVYPEATLWPYICSSYNFDQAA